MESGRRSQGCWTCKHRKIGCDRGYPDCNNCLRTGRKCLGYGIRLAWPDQPDGRRRKSRLPAHDFLLPVPDSKWYGKQFLNNTYDDLISARDGCAAISCPLLRRPPRPNCPVPMMPDVQNRETYLMTYYEDRLSRMISTIDINNGFRDDLLPMALSYHSSASQGLLNAMFALSAFHLWGAEEALPYKAKALRSLSSSLSMTSVGITETQLATSMMLCVYNVFDETEGHWNLHLNGARNILHKLAQIPGGCVKYGFLYTWFLYHEVLGEFSDPVWYYPRGPTSLSLGQEMHFDPAVIIGSLGCSVEVMEIISYVNSLRAIELQEDVSVLSADEKARRNDEWHSIENRLAHLDQRLDAAYASQITQHQRSMILATAELYRIATFLYLQRTSTTAQVHELRTIHLEQAFQVLRSLDICTSPWPLFIIACETETDEQRIEILQMLDVMVNVRDIGNIFVLRSLIESFWKQQDLQADNARPSNLKWWDVVDLNTAAPWFI